MNDLTRGRLMLDMALQKNQTCKRMCDKEDVSHSFNDQPRISARTREWVASTQEFCGNNDSEIVEDSSNAASTVFELPHQAIQLENLTFCGLLKRQPQQLAHSLDSDRSAAAIVDVEDTSIVDQQQCQQADVDDQLTCAICDKKFAKPAGLTCHIKIHLPKGNERYTKPARQCPYCEKSVQGGKLKRHVKTIHNKQFVELKKSTGLSDHSAFVKIRNQGILQRNTAMVRDKRLEYTSIRKCATEKVHCQSCNGSYAKKYFYKHRAHCKSSSSDSLTAKKISAVMLANTELNDDFLPIIDSFHQDEIGKVCRSDDTIKKIGHMLWKKDRTKVDKTDEVRKNVMASMRILSKLFIEFNRLVPSDQAIAMFNRSNWEALSSAISIVTQTDTTCTVKYGLKNTIYYLLMSSADLLQGIALTDKNSTEDAHELVHFKKVLKHHENILFADAKYHINKSRQEKLRLPTRIPPEADLQKLRNFTVEGITKLVQHSDVDRIMFVHLRNLVCSRLTLFNARRGGEPSRMMVDQWVQRDRWLNKDNVSALCEEERALFSDMQITFMTGKGNHLVSCMIPKDCVRAMDMLCSAEVRCAVSVASNNRYIFPNTTGSTHHVDGWYATNYAMIKANVDCKVINATNQRGRISTLYASLDVAEEDRAYFYKHMGHSEQVNAGTYQRPLPVQAMTKVGAVLADIDASQLTARRNNSKKNRRNEKTDDIDMSEKSEDSDWSDSEVDVKVTDRARWTPRSTKSLLARFKTWICLPSPQNSLPAKSDVLEFMSEHGIRIHYRKVRTKLYNEQKKEQRKMRKALKFV